jgi:hypothetical protein
MKNVCSESIVQKNRTDRIIFIFIGYIILWYKSTQMNNYLKYDRIKQ